MDGTTIFELDMEKIKERAEYIAALEEADIKEIIHIINTSPTTKKYILKRYNLIEE